MPMKQKFAVRISEENRIYMEGAFEKVKAHNDKRTDWNDRWDWKQANTSLGAFLVNQAIKQTKADLASIDALEAKLLRKPKGSSSGKVKKGSRKKR